VLTHEQIQDEIIKTYTGVDTTNSVETAFNETSTWCMFNITESGKTYKVLDGADGGTIGMTFMSNADVPTLAFKDVVENNCKELKYELDFQKLSSLVNSIEELERIVYKYQSTKSYDVASKWVNELNNEFYLKYNINLSNNNIYQLNELYENLKNCNNNYLKNEMVSSFVEQKKVKSNFVKKIFGKNEQLSTVCLDFLDENKHDFNVFFLSEKCFLALKNVIFCVKL
jgi:hypothetical protein